MNWLNGWMNQYLNRHWDCQTCTCLRQPEKLFSPFLMDKILFYMSSLLRFSWWSQAQSISSIYNSRAFYSPAVVAVNTRCAYLWVCWVLSKMGTFDSNKDSASHSRSSTYQKPYLISIPTLLILFQCSLYCSWVSTIPLQTHVPPSSKHLIFMTLSDEPF